VVPPEVPVKLLETPIGSVDEEVVGLMGAHCILHTTQTQEERGSQKQLKEGGDDCLQTSHTARRKKS